MDSECQILDPVVERTRQAREALLREYDYDLNKLIDLFRSLEAQHPQRVRVPESKQKVPVLGRGTDKQISR